jgi:hypothetical protein
MATDSLTFARWLQDSAVAEQTLTASQRAVLEAAFAFRQQRGHDYFSRRLLSHFLLHAHTGLKVAQLARLLGFSRSAASAQQGLSSKEVVQASHHRLAGRSHGKLLPRFAGPIAQFLCAHPQASRWDLLDFIRDTWGVSVSRMAVHRFLKKYGLEQTGRVVAWSTPPADDHTPAADESRSADPAAVAAGPRIALAPAATTVAALTAAGPPPAEFFLPLHNTPAPSCCCPEPATG